MRLYKTCRAGLGAGAKTKNVLSHHMCHKTTCWQRESIWAWIGTCGQIRHPSSIRKYT